MIRSLRARHRLVWCLLAILLPVLLGLALWSRPAETASPVVAAEESP